MRNGLPENRRRESSKNNHRPEVANQEHRDELAATDDRYSKLENLPRTKYHVPEREKIADVIGAISSYWRLVLSTGSQVPLWEYTNSLKISVRDRPRGMNILSVLLLNDS